MPCQTCATSVRPPITSPSAGHTRRRTGSCQANLTQSAISTGRAELEEQADPDRQPLDRDEVEPLHDREADDPVEREPAELAARPDPQPLRRDEREAEGQPDEAAGRAELGPAERAHVARLEPDLRDGAVDREHRRGRDRHRVADARPAVAGELSRWQRELGHRSRLDDALGARARGSL